MSSNKFLTYSCYMLLSKFNVKSHAEIFLYKKNTLAKVSISKEVNTFSKNTKLENTYINNFEYSDSIFLI